MKNKSQCEKFFETEISRLEGIDFTGSMKEFREKHLAECSDCDLEIKMLETLAYDETDRHITDLDEVAQRRLISKVLTSVSRKEVQPAQTLLKFFYNKKRFIAMGGAIAAAIALVTAMYFAFPAKNENVPLAPLADNVKIQKLKAGVLLVSSDLKSKKGPISSSYSIVEGEKFATKKGSAVISIGEDIAVMLKGNSSLTVNSLDERSSGIFLNSGEIVVVVTPGNKIPGFYVSTKGGKVKVTGTVFSVKVTPESTDISVLRGSVKITNSRGKFATLRTSSRAMLSQPDKVQNLTFIEKASIYQSMKAIELTASIGSKNSVMVEINSSPGGANVLMDGIFLGITPLNAIVHSGHRKMEIIKDDHYPVTELLDLKSKNSTIRTFELTPVVGADEEVFDKKIVQTLTKSQIIKSPDNQAFNNYDDNLQELLASAQAYRANRNWKMAAWCYNSIVTKYAGTSASKSALISMGQIELRHLGKPGSALATYSKYLEKYPAGSLAREAIFGRIRAYRKLGFKSNEIREIKYFLSRYPSSVRNFEVRKRLSELTH